MREMIAMLDGVNLGSMSVEPGNGQNYVGGGAYPDQGGFPTLVSGSYGLAAARADAETLAGYLSTFAGTRSNRLASVEPGDGQNYTGGAAYPDEGGFPTLVSGPYGLANLRGKAALRGALLAGARGGAAAGLGRAARGLSGLGRMPEANAYGAAFMAATRCGKSAAEARQIARSVASEIT